MEKLNDTSRAEFEAFMADRFKDSIDRRRCKNGDGNDYMSWDMNVARVVWQHMSQRAEAAEAKLAELEKQASEQRPFMYGIMTANGDAHFEDFCVSSDPGLLQDVIWECNNTLADNEPKNRVVALFTRPAPAINLAELVEDEMTWNQAHSLLDINQCGEDRFSAFMMGANYNRAAILSKIEETK